MRAVSETTAALAEITDSIKKFSVNGTNILSAMALLTKVTKRICIIKLIFYYVI